MKTPEMNELETMVNRVKDGYPCLLRLSLREIKLPMDQGLYESLSAIDQNRYDAFSSEKRKLEFSESRRALHEVRGADFAHTSLSHAKNICVAVAVESTLSGVGVDIENKNRKFPTEMLDRGTSKDERGFGLSFIHYWTAKEALFKSNPKNDGTHLTQYEILSPSVNSLGRACGPNSSAYTYWFFETKNYALAVAFCES